MRMKDYDNKAYLRAFAIALGFFLCCGIYFSGVNAGGDENRLLKEENAILKEVNQGLRKDANTANQRAKNFEDAARAQWLVTRGIVESMGAERQLLEREIREYEQRERELEEELGAISGRFTIEISEASTALEYSAAIREAIRAIADLTGRKDGGSDSGTGPGNGTSN